MLYNLQFFAKEGPGGEKTEDATGKKLKDARSEGQVAKSQELVMATSLFGLFYTLKLYVGTIGNKFIDTFRVTYNKITEYATSDFNTIVVHGLLVNVTKLIILILIPIFAAAFVVAFLSNVMQFKWQVTTKPLKPKFNKLNPIKGFSKILSKDKIMELFKSVLKIGVISYIAYDTLKKEWGMITQFYELSLYQAIAYIGNTAIELGIKISSIYLIIGFADLFYQKRKFKTDMKMTKQEIKDEYKNSEGDPHIKGQIKQKMREVSRRRMMQDLPQADVVITNPTHLAVALKYDKDSSEAPIVIAKGADFIAEKIKEVARDNKIEIVENKPLARMLYYNVDIGAEIPAELYQMVAEVLAYVYGLKNNLS
ncbi:flagellar biosynthesis protein FlhB [Anaeromicropila herbilytica]|nr:flagellar biosynthesis protein FlhB [Anaeromicropila herbilytica]